VGLSASDFTHCISSQPGILGYGLHSTIHPAVEALRAVMSCDKNVVQVLKKFQLYNLTLLNNYLVSNVSLLQARGIPIKSIKKWVHHRPWCLVHRTEEFKYSIIQAEKKFFFFGGGGFSGSPMFLYAVGCLYCHREEAIGSKCQVFESFGWDCSDVVSLFRQHLNCLTVSEEKIKAMVGFFL